MKVRNQLKVINEMKKPYVSTSELSRTINKMNMEIQYRVQKVLREDIDYEVEYGHEDYITEQLVEILPNIITNTSYEFIRDLIIKDKTKVEEYDRLQDEISRLEIDVRMEMIEKEIKKQAALPLSICKQKQVQLKVLGEHQINNASLAKKVAEYLKIPEKTINANNP